MIPIIGFEGKYSVSRDGRVWSEARKKWLNPFSGADGGLQVSLGFGTQRRVARLIAFAFVPNPENRRMVRHLDGDRSNCTASNLTWTSEVPSTFSKNVGKVMCRECAVVKTRIRSKRGPDKKFIYRDEAGLAWNRLQCPECRKVATTASGRARGIKPRILLTDHKNQKGVAAELAARAHFERLGYEVKMTCGKGPDLTLAKDGQTTTCEVKSVTITAKNRGYVSGVYSARQSDDLIAIVMPNGDVHVESMKTHLASCPPCGWRTVTKLMRLYGQ